MAHLARVGVTETNLANALGLCDYHHHLAHHLRRAAVAWHDDRYVRL
ncbi:MAG TPA: hypothetical protein VF165_19185 [Nocardioidaceae bacterium]